MMDKMVVMNHIIITIIVIYIYVIVTNTADITLDV